MTTSALSAAAPAAFAVTAAHAAPFSQPISALLTRVSLAYIEPRFKLYLRWRTSVHAPARPLAALRHVHAGCNLLPRSLAGQRLRHDPLAAHGDAGCYTA